MRNLVIVSMICGLVTATVSARAEEPTDCTLLIKQKDEAALKLAEENAALKEKLKNLECAPIISRDELARRNLVRLQGIAADVKGQRQSMADFEVYIKWMTGSLSSYSKYIEAGSAAASFARFLPVPYAGQAGLFAKFVSHFALSLNAASNSIDKYLKTSQQFVTRVEALDTAAPNGAEITALNRFADEQLMRDLSETRARLVTTSELSASTLSFLEGMNHYMGSTDEYWNKTKSLLTRKDVDKKEKSFLTENIQSLKSKAASFNARLKLLEDTAAKEAPLIKTLVAYDELIRDLDTKVAKK